MKELSQAVEDVTRRLGEAIDSRTSVYRRLDKAVASWSVEDRDRLVTNIWFVYYQLGLTNVLKTPHAQRSAQKWFRQLRNGERATFAENADDMLDGFNFKVEGEENIEEGASIYVGNHPKGPMFGTWYGFAINRAVVGKLGKEAEPRPFLKEYSESYLLGETPLRHLRDRACQLIANGTNSLLIRKDRATFGELFGEAQRHLANDGKLFMSFEEQNGDKLTRSKPGVGLFLRIVSENGKYPIVPVGFWKDGDDLNVNFGKPVDVKKYLASLPADIADKTRSQRMIDHIATGVAGLVPPKHRGVYANLVE